AAEKIGGFDLLIFGRHAVDGDTAQTGPATAAFLDIPQVTLVSALEVEDGWARCERELGSVRQTVRVKLPAAVTVCGSINKPRYATPINIMRALKKPRTTWNAADLGCDTSRTGVPGSPSCTKRVFEPEKLSADTTYLSGSPSDMAKALVEALRDRHLICGGERMAREDYKGIWVFAEQEHGTLHPTVFELLAMNEALKDVCGGKIP